jgi:hypothetical protein
VIDILDDRPLYIDDVTLMLGEDVMYRWSGRYRDFDGAFVLSCGQIVVIADDSETGSTVSVIDSGGHLLGTVNAPSGLEVVPHCFSDDASFIAYSSSEVFYFSMDSGSLVARRVVAVGQ